MNADQHSDLICGCGLFKIEQWKSAVVFNFEHPDAGASSRVSS